MSAEIGEGPTGGALPPAVIDRRYRADASLRQSHFFFPPDFFFPPPADFLAEDFLDPPADFFAEDFLDTEDFWAVDFFELLPPDFLAEEELPPPFLDFWTCDDPPPGEPPLTLPPLGGPALPPVDPIVPEALGVTPRAMVLSVAPFFETLNGIVPDWLSTASDV